MFTLDASALSSIFVPDGHSEAIKRWLEPSRILTISDFAAAEFAAAVSRLWRTGELTNRVIEEVFHDFDRWRLGAATRGLSHRDGLAVEKMVRDTRTKLGAADALHIAIAAADGSTLITFDKRQAAAAALLGVDCVVPA